MSKHPDFEEWLQRTADNMVNEPVPEWPRERTFRATAATTLRWWQKPWLPMTSLAASAFAMLLVIGQVQFHNTADGFSVSFGGGVDEAKLTAMVEQRLNEYGAAQQLTLANYASNLREDFREDFRTELGTANQQLVNYVLATNRQERQDDMEDLIRFVNAQREDDQVYFANQLQQFSEDWLEQSSYPMNPMNSPQE